MEDTPIRTNPTDNHCHCLLIRNECRNYCAQPTSGPDDPFCGDCSDRHDGIGNDAIVATYMSIPETLGADEVVMR